MNIIISHSWGKPRQAFTSATVLALWTHWIWGRAGKVSLQFGCRFFPLDSCKYKHANGLTFWEAVVFSHVNFQRELVTVHCVMSHRFCSDMLCLMSLLRVIQKLRCWGGSRCWNILSCLARGIGESLTFSGSWLMMCISYKQTLSLPIVHSVGSVTLCGSSYRLWLKL